jgi:HEAT repeat protein
MRTRRIIGIVFVVVVMVVAFNRLIPREPEYQGRPLTSWLKKFGDGDTNNSLTWERWPDLTPAQMEAAEAIRQMGTNSLPYLLRALTNQDSKLKLIVMSVLHKQSRFKVPVPMADEDRRRAALALHALGPMAKPAIPELTRYLNDYPAGKSAAIALAGIGPEGWAVLTQALTNKNGWTTICAAWALGNHRATVPGTVAALIGQVTNSTGGSAALTEWALAEIGQDSEVVVPVLIHSLQSSSANDVRWSAAQALGKFGTNALSAVPALLQAQQQDSDAQVRNYAKDSLKLIDPDAAPIDDGQVNHHSVSIIHH